MATLSGDPTVADSPIIWNLVLDDVPAASPARRSSWLPLLSSASSWTSSTTTHLSFGKILPDPSPDQQDLQRLRRRDQDVGRGETEVGPLRLRAVAVPHPQPYVEALAPPLHPLKHVPVQGPEGRDVEQLRPPLPSFALPDQGIEYREKRGLGLPGPRRRHQAARSSLPSPAGPASSAGRWASRTLSPSTPESAGARRVGRRSVRSNAVLQSSVQER